MQGSGRENVAEFIARLNQPEREFARNGVLGHGGGARGRLERRRYHIEAGSKSERAAFLCSHANCVAAGEAERVADRVGAVFPVADADLAVVARQSAA